MTTCLSTNVKTLMICVRQRISDNETGITDEPDLTLVSGVTSVDVSSISPEKSVVTTPGRSTSGSLSLISFEQHERSILDQETPKTLRNPPLYAELMAISATDNDVNTDKDAKAVGVRFMLPADNTRQSRASAIMQGITTLILTTL